jgi:hypothetical protein
MSSSIRSRSFSRRSREISADGSGTECGAGADVLGRNASPAFRPPLRPRQLRSIEGAIPSSPAICVSGRSLLASSATASRLNSSVNCRRPWPIRHLSAPSELTKGVHQCGGGSDHAGRRLGDSHELANISTSLMSAQCPALPGRKSIRIGSLASVGNPGSSCASADLRHRAYGRMGQRTFSADYSSPAARAYYV